MGGSDKPQSEQQERVVKSQGRRGEGKPLFSGEARYQVTLSICK